MYELTAVGTHPTCWCREGPGATPARRGDQIGISSFNDHALVMMMERDIVYMQSMQSTEDGLGQASQALTAPDTVSIGSTANWVRCFADPVVSTVLDCMPKYPLVAQQEQSNDTQDWLAGLN